jgi:predicted ribosome quality control (RQC) complex YloA/Tae2 family protein
VALPEDGAPSAIVQEADCAERVVVLKVRVPGRTAFVLVAGRAMPGPRAGLLASGTRQEIWGARLPPGMPRQRPREAALTGARVLAIGDSEVFLDQNGAPRVIRAQSAGVVVTDAQPPSPLRSLVDVLADEDARQALEQRGAAIARALAEAAIDDHRAAVARSLERARTRITRRRDAIAGDLSKIADADAIASRAQWLVGEAARAPRGATKLAVTDWSSGEAVTMEIPLDPARSAREQVEAMFRRAKRLRLGARIAEDRAAQAEAQLAAVARAEGEVAVAASLAAIDEAARQAKSAAPRDVTLVGAGPSAPKDRAKARSEGGRTPYRAFFAPSGTRILVGKGAKDNDALTLKHARPHDLWLHAKDRTGGHVIVPLTKGQTCPAGDLVAAAHLAAHFSDARDEKVVDVQYTPRRYLRKPKGSPPGLVVVDREKVLVLRLDAELLRALLEREDV